MTDDDLEAIRAAARDQAKDHDRYAVVCSDGDFQYARSEDVAMDLLETMRNERGWLCGDHELEYDVVVLNADYDHAGLWSCGGCDGEFIVHSKVDVLSHECGDGGSLAAKLGKALAGGLDDGE